MICQYSFIVSKTALGAAPGESLTEILADLHRSTIVCDLEWVR